MMTTLLLTTGVFTTCMVLLGIGFLVRGMVLKGSCGGAAAALGEDNCGACGKKAKDMCPSDDESGLLEIGTISNPHRTMKERPKAGPNFSV
jgi:hypothetical protein